MCGSGSQQPPTHTPFHVSIAGALYKIRRGRRLHTSLGVTWTRRTHGAQAHTHACSFSFLQRRRLAARFAHVARPPRRHFLREQTWGRAGAEGRGKERAPRPVLGGRRGGQGRSAGARPVRCSPSAAPGGVRHSSQGSDARRAAAVGGRGGARGPRSVSQRCRKCHAALWRCESGSGQRPPALSERRRVRKVGGAQAQKRDRQR